MHGVAGIPVETLTAALGLHYLGINLMFWTSFGVGMLGSRILGRGMARNAQDR
jgi:hypothetical protein